VVAIEALARAESNYGHCLAMLVEAEAAQEVMDRMRSEPQGVVHLSCP
jgi:hypothetical protein